MRHVLLFVSATYFHLLCKVKIFAAKLSGSDLIFDLHSIELFLKLEIQHSDNFSFLLYRQYFLIQRIFLCASNCGLLVFFSFNLAHFFSLHAKLCMEQILIWFFIYGTCSYLFVQNSVCQPFSVIIFSLSFFLFAQQMFMSHCSWWSWYTCYYFTMALKSKAIISYESNLISCLMITKYVYQKFIHVLL